MLYASLYGIPRDISFIKTESRLMVAKVWGTGVGGDYTMVMILVCVIKSALETVGCDLPSSVNVVNIYFKIKNNQDSKMRKMINCMVLYFTILEKKLQDWVRLKWVKIK